MAQNSASRGAGLFDQGTVWDDEIARGAFAGFDTPRRRVTGAASKPVGAPRARSTSPRARTTPADARVPSAEVPARGVGVPGRRTVTIRGYGAERNLPRSAGQSRRHTEPRYQRPGFKADRMAMWAVLLGIVLVVVAAASAHGAVLSRSPGTAASHRSAHVAAPAAHAISRAELRFTARP
ncbi:MAG: hypothetical protein ACR2L9_09640 [Solirubrobacteraceae bacterium]